MRKIIGLIMSAIIIMMSCGSIVACGCDHEYDKGKRTKEATCTEKGIICYTCIKCGQKKEETIKITEHHYVLISTTATCTTSGEDTYRCSKCYKKQTQHSEAKGHTYGDGYFCKYCNKVKDGFYKFVFNTSIFDFYGYSSNGVKLYIGSSVAEGSKSVSFNFLCVANYSVRKTFIVTIINKNTGKLELSITGSSVFDSSMLQLVKNSFTLNTPYSCNNQYYFIASIF